MPGASTGRNEPDLSTAAAYLTFAGEARGRSPAYESLASSVASDDLVLRFLRSLPWRKRQPTLLFAAASYLLGEPPSIGRLRSLVDADPGGLARVMLARRTQTNEPGTGPGCDGWTRPRESRIPALSRKQIVRVRRYHAVHDSI